MIKPVRNYEDRYLVTTNGEVISVVSNGKVLKHKINKYGYPSVNLTDGLGSTKTVCIHRLVAEAFCCRANENYVVNHIDSDKTNNTYTNLEWCSANDNFEHAANKETMRNKVGILRYPKSLDSKILILRAAGASIYKIAEQLCISKSTAHRRIKGLT